MLLRPIGCLPAGDWGWFVKQGEKTGYFKSICSFSCNSKKKKKTICSPPLTWPKSQPVCLFGGLEIYTWPAGTGRETFSPSSRAASDRAALAACPAPGQGFLRARDILLLLSQDGRCCPISADPSLLPARTAPARASVHVLQLGQQAMERVNSSVLRAGDLGCFAKQFYPRPTPSLQRLEGPLNHSDSKVCFAAHQP